MAIGAHDALLLLALLGVVAGLLVSALLLRIAYPILLVVGGILMALIPGLPHPSLNPQIVLVGILPPLLYSTAFYTSVRELRRNIRAISSLSIGLVIATTVAVAAVMHAAVGGMTWSTAFVLGAIVAPTDPIAATSIAERIGLPRNLVAVIEGEGLLNDATALVFYRFAVAAVVSGSFSFSHATWKFFVSVVGGIGVGLAVGFVIRQIRRRLDHSPTEITIALLSGYVAYLPAEALDVSAVLAAVTVGLYMGWYTPELTNARTRLQGDAVWEITTFVVNAVLFSLVGLELRPIVNGITNHSTGKLVLWAAAASGTVVATRAAWSWTAANLQWRVVPVVRDPDRMPSHSVLAVLSWSGMRGAITLAAALALPLSTDAGDRFPQRNLVIFLAFSVIVVTLVVQGLTLPALVRAVNLPTDPREEEEEALAWVRATEAGIARLEELHNEPWVKPAVVARLRDTFELRLAQYAARAEGGEKNQKVEKHVRASRRLRRAILDAERDALVELRRSGEISDAVERRVRRELDFEDARLGGGG
jgi:CPA1 family monovalent cation:H+ antiporter